MNQSVRDLVDTTSTLPSDLSVAEAAALLRQHYGLEAELSELVSERDQNFRSVSDKGERFVLKISNAAEDAAVTNFQIEALLHIAETEEADKYLQAPQIVPTLDGDSQVLLQRNGQEHIARLLTYVDGQPLSEAVRSANLCRDMGRYLAHLGHALREFRHPGENQLLLWDIKRAVELRRLLEHIPEQDLRDAVSRSLDDFERVAVPAFDEMRWQVIHNDFHPDNTLVAAGSPDQVAGVIDFGDMLYSPLIADLGVAASYLRSGDDDPLSQVLQFVAGYNEVEPLNLQEIEILSYLIRARLAASIAILRWRACDRGKDDAYVVETEAGVREAGEFLRVLDKLPATEVAERIREACCI